MFKASLICSRLATRCVGTLLASTLITIAQAAPSSEAVCADFKHILADAAYRAAVQVRYGRPTNILDDPAFQREVGKCRTTVWAGRTPAPTAISLPPTPNQVASVRGPLLKAGPTQLSANSNTKDAENNAPTAAPVPASGAGGFTKAQLDAMPDFQRKAILKDKGTSREKSISDEEKDKRQQEEVEAAAAKSLGQTPGQDQISYEAAHREEIDRKSEEDADRTLKRLLAEDAATGAKAKSVEPRPAETVADRPASVVSTSNTASLTPDTTRGADGKFIASLDGSGYTQDQISAMPDFQRLGFMQDKGTSREWEISEAEKERRQTAEMADAARANQQMTDDKENRTDRFYRIQREVTARINERAKGKQSPWPAANEGAQSDGNDILKMGVAMLGGVIFYGLAEKAKEEAEYAKMTPEHKAESDQNKAKQKAQDNSFAKSLCVSRLQANGDYSWQAANGCEFAQ